MSRSSFYLPMRDGVKIATDLYLPSGLSPGQKIPTILEQNRYGRLIEPRAPFRWVFSPISSRTKLFVTHGYAWVETDVRGSAASFASIPYPWSPDEIRDGNDLANWIVHQPWSDGKVGTIGVSYVGVSAEMLPANRNPAVKAVAAMFAWWDTYTAETFPGGIYLSWLIPRWAQIDDIIDHDAIWKMSRYKWYVPLLISGIPPVDDDRDRAMLREAIAQHNNVDVAQFLGYVTYRDDIPGELAGFADGFDSAVREHMKRVFDSGGGVIELSNPARYKAEIEASGAAIYSFDGWYDGPTCRSAIQRFLDISNPQKIILGSWIHAVTRDVETGERFDDGAELLRFFDYQLKGIANGVMDEPRVTYYTMVEDKWKTAERWPLPRQTSVSWYLGPGHTLTRAKPQTAEASDTYTVDYTAGTGHHTRWEPLIGNEFSGGSSILDYGDRRD
ncbi:MAG TPA: CocE/NonD family hydrolase, partial [Bryobacteraceae bacterium]|nr:CocE/NonD family hydrolase [Bryobacteraceae bacterium]